MEINLLAVLAATVVAFILGGIWYSPFVFGNIWANSMGFTDKDLKKKGIWKSYFGNFLATFVTAYVLAYLLQTFNVKDLFEAGNVVFLIWLGFIFAGSMGSVLWEKRSVKLFFIHTAFNLVQLASIATVYLLMTL